MSNSNNRPECGETMRSAFGCVELSAASADFAALHELVCQKRGRIEITDPGSGECCILISRNELEALEQALEILSGTENAGEMRSQISQLASELRAEPHPVVG
jgi:PHD/YefM family antitoxin component YafN of YafNO toxin-antitoxin module